MPVPGDPVYALTKHAVIGFVQEGKAEKAMDAIRARESRYKTTAGFFAEAGVGYDTNVNGGVGSPNLTLPVFGAVTLQTGTKTADSFGHLAAGDAGSI